MKRKQSPPRLPLDFTKLVASRRANRVAAYKHMEGNNDHFYNIQHAVAMENDFNERQRVEEKLRLGAVPAHVTHRVVDALVARAQGIATVNIEAARQAKIKAAAEAAKVVAREAVEKKKRDAMRANTLAVEVYERWLKSMFTPTPVQLAKYATQSDLSFEKVMKKQLTGGEIAVRSDDAAAGRLPNLIESGNAKLRAIYE